MPSCFVRIATLLVSQGMKAPEGNPENDEAIRLLLTRRCWGALVAYPLPIYRERAHSKWWQRAKAGPAV